jgi:hypothetical protein
LKDMNGTAAYRRVHPTAKASTCAVEASRILRNPKVRALIEQERKKLTERFGMTKEDVVASLIAIVRAVWGRCARSVVRLDGAGGYSDCASFLTSPTRSGCASASWPAPRWVRSNSIHARRQGLHLVGKGGKVLLPPAGAGHARSTYPLAQRALGAEA